MTHPGRGGADAYQRYFAGMDASMDQKARFPSAQLLTGPGARILDLGCGSGALSARMAALAPNARLTGIDIGAGTIAQAAAGVHSVFIETVAGPDGPSLDGEQVLEMALPTHHGAWTIAVLPIGLHPAGDLLVGLERRLLPVAQLGFGQPAVPTVPGWRLDMLPDAPESPTCSDGVCRYNPPQCAREP